MRLAVCAPTNEDMAVISRWIGKKCKRRKDGYCYIRIPDTHVAVLSMDRLLNMLELIAKPIMER